MKSFIIIIIIFTQLIAKRETLWEEKLKLENDPTSTTLNARGGALLKSLQKKQSIEKQLPKLEKELKSKVVKWQTANNNKVMIVIISKFSG